MTKKETADYCTVVPDAALREAIHVWMHTGIIHLHTIAGDRQDLYLRLIAMATGILYEEVLKRFQAGDQGVLRARRSCKRIAWLSVMVDPPALLRIHDAVLVQGEPAVESTDAHEELEDCADQPLHPPS